MDDENLILSHYEMYISEKAFIEVYNKSGKRVAISAIVGENRRFYLSTKEGEI